MSKPDTDTVKLFFEAVGDGDLDKVKSYLEAGEFQADITNIDGLQAIHLATSKGHLQIVKYILSRKGISPKVTVKVIIIQ